jgi:hypothetical protein
MIVSSISSPLYWKTRHRNRDDGGDPLTLHKRKRKRAIVCVPTVNVTVQSSSSRPFWKARRKAVNVGSDAPPPHKRKGPNALVHSDSIKFSQVTRMVVMLVIVVAYITPLFTQYIAQPKTTEL